MSVVVIQSAGRWTAWQDGRAVGSMDRLVRPDGRCFLLPGTCPPRVLGRLLDAATAATGTDLYIEADGPEDLGPLEARGFVVHRREHHYALPVRADGPSLPPGYDVIGADAADPEPLRLLDDRLRQDVPGTAGWRNDPASFARDLKADPGFDPALYLVALEARTGEYAGLVRVWIREGRPPRLGLIGVLPDRRGRGLAGALLGRVSGVLHARGVPEMVCEVDETNSASNRLMAAVGARRTGGSVELIRRRPQRPGVAA
ncbi:hypothetical protein GCM10009716_24920 [Streptomyces sodiiphilus]|uniref:N-acetyltransferase domain-containing protein n=1 Tax=Streptomyces sodiiphilus TaxID=226217 RepID=A0ABN2P8V7_9ACTN